MTERFKKRLADVIRRPLITEKATKGLELNQYTFEVDHRAAKPEIKAVLVRVPSCSDSSHCPFPNASCSVTLRF